MKTIVKDLELDIILNDFHFFPRIAIGCAIVSS